MTGFFVDAQEQREKARRAEQRLLEHDAVRVPRRRGLDETDADEGLPPVFERDGAYQQSRETSVERRAVRCRDGLPPPPLDVDPGEIQRVLPPPPPILVDQRQFDAHRGGASPRASENGELTHSQKKRLRRKRHRDEARAQGAAPPVNGVVLNLPPPMPTDLDPDLSVRESCEAECTLVFPDESTQRVICRLVPFPHPNQPHLVQIRDAHGTPGSHAEIFVGFWLPGE